MGNCCKPASPMEWDGEDWSFLTSNSKNTSSRKVFDEAHGDGSHGLCLGKVQKEKLMGVFDEAHDDGSHGLCLGKVQKEKLMGVLRASDPNANGIVKIKISKKELAELLENQQKVNKKQEGRASAEQVLLRLIKARDHDAPHSRFWRPVLETIPEVS